MRGESKYPLVAGGQRDNRVGLAKTTVRSCVTEEASKSHAHCDVTHAMTMTRTGLRAAGRCGRVLHDCSKDFPDSVTMAPRLRTEKKLTDIPIVARSLSRTDESASSTAPIHIPRHNRDDDESHKCSSSTSWLTSLWACSWALGLSCETPAVFGPPGLHTTALELETCTFEALQNTTKIPREATQREGERIKHCDGRGKKKRKILGLPPFGAPPFEPHPSASPLHFLLGGWAHPSVSTFRGPPFWAHPANKHMHNARKRSKKHKQLTKKLKQITLSKKKPFQTTKTLSLAQVGLAKVGLAKVGLSFCAASTTITECPNGCCETSKTPELCAASCSTLDVVSSQLNAVVAAQSEAYNYAVQQKGRGHGLGQPFIWAWAGLIQGLVTEGTKLGEALAPSLGSNMLSIEERCGMVKHCRIDKTFQPQQCRDTLALKTLHLRYAVGKALETSQGESKQGQGLRPALARELRDRLEIMEVSGEGSAREKVLESLIFFLAERAGRSSSKRGCGTPRACRVFFFRGSVICGR